MKRAPLSAGLQVLWVLVGHTASLEENRGVLEGLMAATLALLSFLPTGWASWTPCHTRKSRLEFQGHQGTWKLFAWSKEMVLLNSQKHKCYPGPWGGAEMVGAGG